MESNQKFTLSSNLEILGPSYLREFYARFVCAGQVLSAGNKLSNLYIDEISLRDSASMFNKKPVFVDHSGYFDHPSLTKLSGITSGATYNSDTKSIDGTITFLDTEQGRAMVNLLDNLFDVGNPDVGLSIVIYPEYQELDNEIHISKINHVESIDLVFAPAAGGEILKALSIDLGENVMTEEFETSQPDPQEEAFQFEPAADPWLTALSTTTISAMIDASGLPLQTKDHLRKRKYSTPDELSTAIEAERTYLATLAESNVINIGNNPPRASHVSLGRDSLDQIKAAFEALLLGVNPPSGIAPLTGVRELYHLLSGDYEMTGLFQPDRIQFANVTTSTMANMTADLLNKRVMAEFQQYPQWWLPIVNIEDFSSLQDVKWIVLGGVGELPTVSEGAAYTELTWDDQKESDAFVKKGGYLGITIEAIDKDDTGRLRAAPRALAQAAWLTLSKSISAIFTSSSGVGPTMSDSVALFDAGHGNLGTTALSVTTWAAARLAMRKQTELNSGERLGALTAPKFLLVPPDLEITALQVLASEYDYTYALSNGTAAPQNAFTDGDSVNARMNFARSRVIVVDLWTDTNNWAAAGDPMLYPTIGLGFRYGRVPEIFSVASPTAGLMFTNDTMPVKVRYFYATGPIDYRNLYKANVA